MTKRCSWILSLALVALMGLAPTEARAGALSAVIIIPGATLAVTGPFGTVTMDAAGTHLEYNVPAINGFLAANGSALRFATGSGASSNQNIATNASGAVLGSAGSVGVVPTSAGTTTMSIVVFQTDWNTPSGTSGTLFNSGKTTFTNTATGDTNSYNSWYDNTNTGTSGPPSFTPLGLPAGLVTNTSTGLNPNSPPGVPADQTSAAISPFITPFALTNMTNIALTNTGMAGETDAYGVQTKVAAAGIIPEPSSVVLMLTSMPLPLVVLGIMRRYRRAAVA